MRVMPALPVPLDGGLSWPVTEVPCKSTVLLRNSCTLGVRSLGGTQNNTDLLATHHWLLDASRLLESTSTPADATA